MLPKISIFTLLLLSVAVIFSADCSDQEIYKQITKQLYRPTLYAPWRNVYLFGSDGTSNDTDKQSCPFCMQLNQHDDKRFLILHRFKHYAIFLNLYPYTPGHLLIIPYDHVKRLGELSQESRFELIELITGSTTILEEILKCDGVNVGINFGRVAGSSIPDHLHVHILPRRKNELAFIQLIGETRIISCDMNKLYEQLQPHFMNLQSSLSP